MNGQIYQLCCLAVAARRALQSKAGIADTTPDYVDKIVFQFLPERKLFFSRAPKVDSITAWFEHCVNKGLVEVKLLLPLAVPDRGLLGFSNTAQSCLVCYYKNQVTYFTAHWEFAAAAKLWQVLYTEQSWEQPPAARPQFADNTAEFITALSSIRQLAHEIECDHFAEVFQKAKDILSTTEETLLTQTSLEIPKPHLRLFLAASTADVFGAMGSWNDSPPYMAEEKGLSEQYDTLSNELLKQIRLAILYAVNEW